CGPGEPDPSCQGAADQERDGQIRGAAEMSSAATGTKNTERLMKVLLAPVVSEKSTFIGEKNNQYAFRVTSDATKPEIKAAVELMFSPKARKIEVLSVQVANV